MPGYTGGLHQQWYYQVRMISWHHGDGRDVQAGRGVAEPDHAAAVQKCALHDGLHHGRRAHAVSWLRCCGMAPWLQATGWRRQRRRHLHPLLLRAVLACSSSVRDRELRNSCSAAEQRHMRRVPCSARQAHPCLRCQPRASCLRGCQPCQIPRCRRSRDPAWRMAPCGAVARVRHGVQNTTQLAKGVVRGLSTHALRLILCTCDEWTCRAAAECILRLQSGHRQCFSCR